MRYSIPLTLCLTLMSLIASCEKNPTDGSNPEPLRELTAVEKQLTQVDNTFGLQLFRQLVALNPSANIFISPLSVALALGMAYNGSDGTTREAMRSTLQYDNLDDLAINEAYRTLSDLLRTADSKVQFEIANSIWYRTGFSVLETFINLNRTYFDAEVSELNFNWPNAVDIINDWVKTKTHDKIPDIIQPPIDQRTVMYLINAIYFKAIWTNAFDPDETVDDVFYQSNGSTSACRMMRHRCEHGYYQTEKFTAVDLAYGDAGFSLTAILPANGINLDSLIAQLTAPVWSSMTANFVQTDMNLFLPKFKLSYREILNNVLCSLGMGVAFAPGTANFHKINPNADLFISAVLHKSFIDVNEEGTEAAAVTAIVLGVTSNTGDPMPVTVVFNRPFIFAICERYSGTILFIGKITEPIIEE